MWLIAGVLLGLMVLVGLVGFHTGPHAHAVAGAIGVAAAAWLIVMVFTGRSAPLLWALLAADLVVSIGVGVIAWKGLSSAKAAAPDGHHGLPEGAEGVAFTALTPEGIVLVRGEQWSAVSLNGNVPAGDTVHVLQASGVRLEVWREAPPAGDELFRLDAGEVSQDSGRDVALSPSTRSSPASQPSVPPAPGDPESKELSS